jgi:hypothetical protein
MRRSLLAAAVVLSSCLVSSRAEQVVFSEIMYNPPAGKPEFLELWNITNTPLDFAKWTFIEGITYTFPDISAGNPQEIFLKAGERIVVSSADPAITRAAYGIPANVRVYGPWTGALDNAGESVTLQDKNGVGVCSVDYNDSGRWSRAADGAGYSLVLKNENNDLEDPNNWSQSVASGGSPGVAETVAIDQNASTLVDFGDIWKYTIPTSDPGSTWIEPEFNDSTWSSGPGLIGYSSIPASVPAPGLQTTTPDGATVVLLRKSFNFDGNPAGAKFVIDQIVDDAVVY